MNNSNIYTKVKKPFYKILPFKKNSLLDFKDQSRNIRLLKIDFYNGKKALNNFKESLVYNEAQTMYFEYSKKEEKKLINIFNDNFNSYITYLKRKETKESITIENLMNKKNMLINNIMILGNRINKMLSRFEHYLESKSFLLCVKEYSINFKKFSKESQLDILFDLYKLFNYQKGYYKMDNIDNLPQFKNWLIKNSKNIKGSDNLKKSMFFNYILSSIDFNNIFDIFSCINQEYIKNHKIKNIFKSFDDFNRALINNQMQIRLSLDKFTLSNDKLTELKKELNNEIKRKENLTKIFNQTSDKYYLSLEKLNIAKTNYIHNKFDNKVYLNKKIEFPLDTKEINDKLNIIINRIINYNSGDIKKIKFERTDKKTITIIDKIRYIEKIMNFLMQYKEEQKYLNEINYEKVMKVFKKEQLMRKFRNKEETLKKLHELKIKKILEKKDKILFFISLIVILRRLFYSLFKKVLFKGNFILFSLIFIYK